MSDSVADIFTTFAPNIVTDTVDKTIQCGPFEELAYEQTFFFWSGIYRNSGRVPCYDGDDDAIHEKYGKHCERFHDGWSNNNCMLHVIWSIFQIGNLLFSPFF